MLTKLDSLLEILKKAKEELSKDARNPALAPKERKIKELQAKIDAGTYKPDPKKIAEKVIQSGHLDKEEDVEKSGYGPKKGGQYTVADNVRRKAGNTGDQTGIGPNVNTKSYSTKPGQLSAKAQASQQASTDKKKSKKQPVKVFTEEEKKKLAEGPLGRIIKTQYKDYDEEDAAAPLIPSKEKEMKDKDKKKLKLDNKKVELLNFSKSGQWTLEVLEKGAAPKKSHKEQVQDIIASLQSMGKELPKNLVSELSAEADKRDTLDRAKQKIRRENRVQNQNNRKDVQRFNIANQAMSSNVVDIKAAREAKEKDKAENPDEVPYTKLQDLTPEEHEALGEHLRDRTVNPHKYPGQKMTQQELQFLDGYLRQKREAAGTPVMSNQDVQAAVAQKQAEKNKPKVITRKKEKQEPFNPAVSEQVKIEQPKKEEKPNLEWNPLFAGHMDDFNKAKYDQLTDEQKAKVHEHHNTFMRTVSPDHPMHDDFMNRLKFGKAIKTTSGT